MLKDRIYQLRRQKGLSQEELGNILGVSRQAISKWENGTALPEIDKIIALSDYFEVSTDFLLKENVFTQVEYKHKNTKRLGKIFIVVSFFCLLIRLILPTSKGGSFIHFDVLSLMMVLTMVLGSIGIVLYFKER